MYGFWTGQVRLCPCRLFARLFVHGIVGSFVCLLALALFLTSALFIISFLKHIAQFPVFWTYRSKMNGFQTLFKTVAGCSCLFDVSSAGLVACGAVKSLCGLGFDLVKH